MKVALIHDWLDTYRGGEKVLEKFAELFPNAPIYTLFYDPRWLPDTLTSRKVVVSSLNPLKKYRKLTLPLLPSAIESFNLNEFDFILSSSSCVAKGVIPEPEAQHLCYIHSPMRYIWDQREQYFTGFKKVPGLVSCMNYMSSQLRQWDVSSSHRVDRFIANSSFVQKRIERYYRRESGVIHPPVNIDFFKNGPQVEKSDYFLIAGAFVSYKKVDLAIKACEQAGQRLIVTGSGPYEKHLRQIAGKNTSFEVGVGGERWRELLAGAKALLFPGIEDFGILPIETMACGTPVLAFDKGGARDYVKPGVNGDFFAEQTVECLVDKITSFKASDYDKSEIQKSVEDFHEDRFKERISAEITKMTGVEI